MIEEEEKYLIEDGQDGEAAAEGEKGILSNSTLAALQKHTSSSGGKVRTAAPTAAPAGPLVGYGSDDDSD